jgi:hypothetical protein
MYSVHVRDLFVTPDKRLKALEGFSGSKKRGHHVRGARLEVVLGMMAIKVESALPQGRNLTESLLTMEYGIFERRDLCRETL